MNVFRPRGAPSETLELPRVNSSTRGILTSYAGLGRAYCRAPSPGVLGWGGSRTSPQVDHAQAAVKGRPTRWVHNPETRNGTAGNPSRNASDFRPFTERAILDSSQWPSAPESESAGVQGFTTVPNPSESFAAGRGGASPSRAFTALPKPFAAPLLHGAPRRPRARRRCGRSGCWTAGRGNLLSVRDVAARLGVSTATVYGLCARGSCDTSGCPTPSALSRPRWKR